MPFSRRITAPGAALWIVLGLAACDPGTVAPVPIEDPPLEIVVLSDMYDGYDLWRVPLDGTGPIRLTDDEPREREYAWGPGGDRVAVIKSGPEPSWSLHVVPVDGSAAAEYRATGLDRFAWAPDGSALAVAWRNADGFRELFLLSVDGSGGATALTGPHQAASDGWPSWAPDGSALVFVRAFGPHSDLYLIRADGEGLTQLTATPDLVEAFPAWSPDGTRVAYTAQTAEDREIHVLDLVDGTVVNLSRSPETRDYPPVWSPDGSRVAWTAYDPDYAGPADIAVATADGSGRFVRAEGPPQAARPAWSPDGSTIAFNGGGGDLETVHVFLADADLTNVRRLLRPDQARHSEIDGDAWRPRP